DLSHNHMSKIASTLVNAGFITSVRGRSGGLSLAKPAEEISVGAVLRALKDRQPVAECFGANTSCRILPACGLRGPLQSAQEAFFAALDPVTIAAISHQSTQLKTLIAIED
ncbi:MAG: RrF2 family transcriptional regulator, partial [Planktomarina sp.]